MFGMILEIITSAMIFGLLIHAIKSMGQMDVAAAQSAFLRAKIENIDKTFAALLRLIERSVLEQQKKEEEKEKEEIKVEPTVKEDTVKPEQKTGETKTEDKKNVYKTSEQDD